MRQIRTLGWATVLAVGAASTCFAVTGRDAAGNPNGAPPETLEPTAFVGFGHTHGGTYLAVAPLAMHQCNPPWNATG